MQLATDVGARDDLGLLLLQRSQLVVQQLAGQRGLQQRVGAGRAAAQMAVRNGNQLVADADEQSFDAACKLLSMLQGTGAVEVLEAWQNPTTKRPAAISNTRLAQLRDTLLPVRVEG